MCIILIYLYYLFFDYTVAPIYIVEPNMFQKKGSMERTRKYLGGPKAILLLLGLKMDKCRALLGRACGHLNLQRGVCTGPCVLRVSSLL
jgi:hypothetical protein